MEGLVAKAVQAAVQVVWDEFYKLFNELKDGCTSLEVRIESLERQHLETVPDTVSDVGNLTDILNAIREENRRIALAANDTE